MAASAGPSSEKKACWFLCQTCKRKFEVCSQVGHHQEETAGCLGSMGSARILYVCGYCRRHLRIVPLLINIRDTCVLELQGSPGPKKNAQDVIRCCALRTFFCIKSLDVQHRSQQERRKSAQDAMACSTKVQCLNIKDFGCPAPTGKRKKKRERP